MKLLLITMFSLAFLIACGGSDKPELENEQEVKQAPSVNAGNDITANEQSPITLMATATDSDGTIDTYNWSQISGTSVTLTSADSASASFVAPDIVSDEQMVFQINVSDNDSQSATDTVTVNLNRVNQTPIANVSLDQSVFVGANVTIDGSASNDPDGDNITYLWSVDGPPESSSTLSNNTQATTEFTPDLVGDYLVSLIVNDGEASSFSDSSTITVAAVPPSVEAKINGSILTFNSNDVRTSSQASDIIITVSLLDENDTVLLTDTPEAVFNQSVQNDLRFSSAISAPGAVNVAVTVAKSGFTSYSRRSAIAQTSRIEAKLTEIPLQTIQSSIKQSVSGQSTDGFNIDMMSQQGAGGIAISIPQSLLPDDTTALSVAVETFDPNDPSDAEFFPGEYKDSSGQQLVSVAFNYAEIMTQSGEPVATAINRKRQHKAALYRSSKAAVADEDPVIINRNIPASSCNILNSLGDSDKDTIGFQIPIYTSNPKTGLWDLLGQGSVYDSNGNLMSASKNDFDCQSNAYVLEILVTNDIFLSQWWNLDYPLLFSEPVTLCAALEVSNQENQLLSNVFGLVSDKDQSFDFNAQYFTTDENGQALVKVTRTSGNEDLSADVLIFNSDSLLQSEIILSDNCENPPMQEVVVNRPQLCAVSGKSIYVNGQPAVGNLIYGYSINNAFGISYDFVNVNEDGEYHLNLNCDSTIQLYDYTSFLSNTTNDSVVTSRSVNVNESLGSDEISDDGLEVVAEDFTVDYFYPTAIAIPFVQTDILYVQVYASTILFPLDAVIYIEDVDGNEISSQLTQFVADPDELEETFWFLSISPLQEIKVPETTGAAFARIEFTDSLGNVTEHPRVQFSF